MSKERILAFNQSRKLSKEELEGISGGVGSTTGPSGHGSYDPNQGADGAIDVNWDY